VKSKRPVNLDLSTLSYPPMAIVSILHRISGVLLFVLMPFVLYVLSLSLRSADSFEQLHASSRCLYVQLALWLFGAALIYHLLAGIRHLLADIGFGESLHASRRSAQAVMLLTLGLIILLGMLIW